MNDYNLESNQTKGKVSVQDRLQSDKNVNIDIVRIFATFLVLSVHIGQVSGMDFSVGAKGVELFFILSGYLAFASLNRNCSAKEYYRKRMRRILPTYWTCLIFVYIEDIILGVCQGLSAREIFTGQCGPKFLRYIFCLQLFTPTNNWDTWNNHRALWTMSCFMGFYVLAPFLYRIMKNLYWGVCILGISLIGTPFIAHFMQQILSGYPEEAHIEWFALMNPISELYCFLMGAVLFLIIKKQKEYFLIGVSVIMTITSFRWYPYEFLFILLIATAVKVQAIIKSKRIRKAVSYVSRGTFTVYLVHPNILAIDAIIWSKLGIESKMIHAAILYISCIAVAYMLYYIIIIRIENRISYNKKLMI